MKILYMDMEFANGKVPGSIYSVGYMMTDENFETIKPATDLLINPECEFNEYVAEHILAYPKEEIEAAPNFAARYEELCALFDEAEIVVGFAIGNDTRALRKACDRAALPQIQFQCIDMEPLCKMMEKNRQAHGLSGLVEAWCGQAPENQHRSDGDALATMMLFRALCQEKHADPDMMIAAYPEACCEAIPAPTPKKMQKGNFRHKHRHHRRGNHRKASKQTPSNAV